MSDRYVCLYEDWDYEIQQTVTTNVNWGKKVFASDVYCCLTENWDLEIDEIHPSDIYQLTFSSWALQVEYEERMMDKINFG
jgi:hypothetical protein